MTTRELTLEMSAACDVFDAILDENDTRYLCVMGYSESYICNHEKTGCIRCMILDSRAGLKKAIKNLNETQTNL